MMILDTIFLIDLLRNDDSAVEKIKYLQLKNIPISITTPSIVEIWTGLVHGKRSEKERKMMLNIMDSQIILELGLESAKMSGEINGGSMKTGKPIGIMDSMIAGIALVNNERILTRNVKDFSRVKGLEIKTY